MAKIGRPKIWTDEVIQDLADAFIEWAARDDSLVLGEFYGIQGISYYDAIEFAKKNLYFLEAKRKVTAIVGARREKEALKGNLDSGIVRKSMALYDPEMKEYEMELKNASSTGVKDIIEQGVINAVRDINAQREKGIDGSSGPSMENK